MRRLTGPCRPGISAPFARGSGAADAIGGAHPLERLAHGWTLGWIVGNTTLVLGIALGMLADAGGAARPQRLIVQSRGELAHRAGEAQALLTQMRADPAVADARLLDGGTLAALTEVSGDELAASGLTLPPLVEAVLRPDAVPADVVRRLAPRAEVLRAPPSARSSRLLRTLAATGGAAGAAAAATGLAVARERRSLAALRALGMTERQLGRAVLRLIGPKVLLGAVAGYGAALLVRPVAPGWPALLAFAPVVATAVAAYRAPAFLRSRPA